MMKWSLVTMVLGALLLWSGLNYSKNDLNIGQKMAQAVIEKIIIDSERLSEQEKQLTLQYIFGIKP